MNETDGRETTLSDLGKLRSVFRFSSFSVIRRWCRPVRRILRMLYLFSVLYVLISLTIPLITRELVDGAVAGAVERLWRYGLLLTLVIVLERVFSFLTSYFQNKASACFQKEMQQYAIRELLSRNYAALKPYHSGELVNRLFSDVTVIREGVTQVLPSLLRTVVSFIGAAVILVILDWRFIPALLLGSVIWVGFTRLFRQPIRQRHRRMQQAEDALHASTQETIENIRVLKAGGSEDRAISLVRKHSEDLADAQIRNGKLAVFVKSGVGSVMDLSWLLCYLWGCIKIYRGEFSYGSLAALIPLVGKFQNPVANAANLVAQLYAIVASTERLQEVLTLPEDENLGDLEDFDRIVLDHVSFRYEDDSADVLQDACGEIRKGDFIALTGPSGEGKTSLFQLLLGIWRPTAGRVVFIQNGKTVPASKGIRKLFAYVPQGNTLFSGTLRDNLLLFTEHASSEEINAAVKMACIDDLVEEIGLDAVLGEHGIGLSEGQAQRVAVARALLSEAPVLLLDEATSALDEQTEADLLKNIADLRRQGLHTKTVIIVTHRPAASKICDRHWRIEQGKLLENG